MESERMSTAPGCPVCADVGGPHGVSGKTPGQRAFAAYYERQAGAALDMPASWDMQSDRTRSDWEAAATAGAVPAHERTAELLGELEGVRAELETSRDDFLFERKQVIALRQVLTEVFTCLDAKDAALFDDDQVTEWRERSGVEAAPAIVTAGTEYVVAELAGDGEGA